MDAEIEGSDRLWPGGPTPEELEEFERDGDQEWPWGDIPEEVSQIERSQVDHDFSNGFTHEQIQEVQRMVRAATDHLALPIEGILGPLGDENAWERFMDDVEQDSRWHSSNHGVVDTADAVGDSLIAELREFGRSAGEDEGVSIWAHKLRHLLKTYENESRPLFKLADSGRVITILLTALETSRAVLNVQDRATTTWWFKTFQQERDERISYYEILLADEATLIAEMGDEKRQLEVLTLLKHGFDKYGEILTAREESVISSLYDRLVELSGLVVGELPDWFATSQNTHWIDVDETPLEAEGEEGCVRQASVLYQLLHPHVRKMYAACHVGKPFIVHAQTRGILTDKNYWRTFYECALGMQYIHERGFVHRLWTDDTIEENVRRHGFITGINLIHLREAEAAEARRAQAQNYACETETKVVSDSLALSADVKAFGLKIFDMLSSSYYSTGDFSSTRLPDSQPPFLVIQEWNLLQAMCAESPSARLCIQEVVHTMESLAKMRENSASSVPDEPIDDIQAYVYHPSRSQSISAILRAISDVLNEPAEFKDVNRAVYVRLENIFQQLVALPGPVQAASVENYCGLLSDFHEQLERRSSGGFSFSSSVATCASRHIVADSYSLHQRIDQLLLEIPGLDQAAPVHQWKPTWEQLQTQYCAAFQGLSIEAEQLANEEDSREAKAYLEYEFNNVASRSFENIHHTLPRWFTPRYLVDFGSHIADGGFGSVCLGKLLGADVVIKQLKSADMTTKDWLQFRHELDLWFSLNHENLIKLYGACHVRRPFFVCERATQGTLVSALEKNSQLNVWVMLWYAAKGLEHLHDNGIIHGDLKGNNILVCDGDMFKRPIAKLADFGLSVLANGKTSGDQGAVGAVRWKAPEILDGAPPSFASDIYSFGMFIVEAVSGQFPWGTIPDSAVKHNVTKLRTLPPLPPQLQHNKRNLIERMCAFDPDERINAGAVVHILLRFSQQTQRSETL